jgi:hypothetical protein
MDEKEIYIAEPDVKAECREQVIQELEKHFLEWREKILRNIYRQNCRGSMRPCKSAAEEDLVQNGGREDNHNHFFNGYPGPEYFQKHILPTLQSLTDDPDELLDAGCDSVEILEHLMCGELSYTSNHTSRALLNSFFENVTVSRGACRSIFGGSRDGEGQFKYFYSLGKSFKNKKSHRFSEQQKEQLYEARKWLTAAIAKHQGWECDRHYDGLDYTNSLAQVSDVFLPAYRAVPLEFRGKAMKAFVGYGGHVGSHAYLRGLPKMVKKLKEEGNERYLRYYFEVAELAPKLDWNHEKCEQFPITQPDKLLEEFRVLDGMGEYREQAFRLLKFACGTEGFGMTFLNPQKTTNFLGTSKVSFPKIVSDLQAAGYSPQEINKIIDIPLANPWLYKSTPLILIGYPHIDKNFPGGFAALLPYLERIKRAPDCIICLLQVCEKGELPKANLGKYLELGTELVAELGNSAKGYFSVGSSDSDYAKLAETDWQKFEELTNDARGNAERFLMAGHRGQDMTFQQSLCYCTDPNYDEWKSGLFVLQDRISKTVDSAEDTGKRVPLDLWDTAIFHYTSAAYDEISPDCMRKNYGISLPDGAHYQNHARIIAKLAERNLYYGDEHAAYSKLRREGLDYRAACHIATKFNAPSRITFYAFDPVDGVECPIPKETIAEVIDILNKTLLTITSAIQGNSDEIDALENRLVSTQIAELRSLGKRAEELCQNPEVGLVAKILHLEEKIEQAVSMLYLRGLIFGPIGKNDRHVNIPADSFTGTTNEHTRMAITGISLLSAAGVIDLPGMPAAQGRLRTHLSEKGWFAQDDLAMLYEASDSLRYGIAERLPFVEQMILKERDKMPGLMPIGGKIHTQRPMEEETIKFIMGIFGLGQTPFQLLHAGSSLLIPPMATALEFNMLIKILELFGVVDPQFPDIQLAMAGRWDERQAPYVGSAVLLGTDVGVTYEDGAFSTAQHNDKTGARIMAYDAGVKKEGLPFDVKAAEGRTDMLGRHSLGDTYIYQLLGTLASHNQFGGIFGDRISDVNHGLSHILKRHGLDERLFASAWVYDHAKPGDGLRDHERMIRLFTEARMATGSNMIKADVQRLIQGTQLQIMSERKKVIAENPKEYERLMKF